MPFDGRHPRPLVTAAEVSAIARGADPVRRNLEITQSYHDLSLAFGRRLGQRDACWVLFAVWASKTAGSFIRGPWGRPALRRLGPLVEPVPALWAIDARVRRYAALGNQIVYAEIAPLFVTLLGLLDAPPSQRAAQLAEAVAALRPGPVEHGGQDGLRRALVAMVEATELPAGPARAERMLLANLRIGAHEQYRLQEAVAGALDATWTPGRACRRWRRVARRRLAPLLRRRLTRSLLHMGLPGLTLEVGRDVPALPHGAMFPADLERVRCPELRAVIERFDRAPATTEGSAARDWADYGDRMNYIVDLFRSRQQSISLWSAPFSPEQTAAIRSGHVPSGAL
ncbi:MAG: hypothetical protein KDK70_19430 [Myxococcales bacterium]|nr:hypothetical protein [Myxococcales bacterium]